MTWRRSYRTYRWVATAAVMFLVALAFVWANHVRTGPPGVLGFENEYGFPLTYRTRTDYAETSHSWDHLAFDVMLGLVSVCGAGFLANGLFLAAARRRRRGSRGHDADVENAGPIDRTFPSRLATAWATRRRYLEGKLEDVPSHLRAPFWALDVHILAFLLNRYGAEPGIDWSPTGLPPQPAVLHVSPDPHPRGRFSPRRTRLLLLRISAANHPRGPYDPNGTGGALIGPLHRRW